MRSVIDQRFIRNDPSQFIAPSFVMFPLLRVGEEFLSFNLTNMTLSLSCATCLLYHYVGLMSQHPVLMKYNSVNVGKIVTPEYIPLFSYR